MYTHVSWTYLSCIKAHWRWWSLTVSVGPRLQVYSSVAPWPFLPIPAFDSGREQMLQDAEQCSRSPLSSLLWGLSCEICSYRGWCYRKGRMVRQQGQRWLETREGRVEWKQVAVTHVCRSFQNEEAERVHVINILCKLLSFLLSFVLIWNIVSFP